MSRITNLEIDVAAEFSNEVDAHKFVAAQLDDTSDDHDYIVEFPLTVL